MQDLTCKPQKIVGRYAIFDEFASGGMATVHLGRFLGVVGFSRVVAIKRLYPQLAKDPEFAAMFLDEARMAARIHHPNVVSTLDVVDLEGELFLVMEYVHGESLAQLMQLMEAKAERIPIGVVGTVMSGVLQGLHAAHEAKSDRGEPLGIVHRDVSPSNVLVGLDGVARLVDFGVAKAAGRHQTTREGQIKGKLAYMAPEQIHGAAVNRQTDVFGASVVLWQALTGRKLFEASNDGELVYKILQSPLLPPSRFCPQVPAELDQVVMRGLARDLQERFKTAHEMAVAFEKAAPLVSQREVAEWVDSVAWERLSARAQRVADIESNSSGFLLEAGLIPSPRIVSATSQPSIELSEKAPAQASQDDPAPADQAPSSQPTQDRASQPKPFELQDASVIISMTEVPRHHPAWSRKLRIYGTVAAAMVCLLVVVSWKLGAQWSSRAAASQATSQVLAPAVGAGLELSAAPVGSQATPRCDAVSEVSPLGQVNCEPAPAQPSASAPSSSTTNKKPRSSHGSSKSPARLYVRE